MSQNNEFSINTELNTDGVKKGAQDINKTMENVAKETSQATQSAGENIEKTGSKFSAVADKIINKAAEVKEAVQNSLSADATIDTSKAVDLENSPVEATVEQAQSLKDRIVAALDEAATSVYQSGGKRAELIANTLSTLAGTVDNFGNTTRRVFDGIFRGSINGAIAGVKKLITTIWGLGSAVVGTIGNKLGNGLKNIGRAALNTAKNVITLHRSNNNLTGGIKKGMWTILKYGVGIRSLYILFRKLRAAAKEGFSNLAKEDSKTNASISALSSSLATLKNALATAFAPIVNVVAPILTSFVNQLVAVANTIGSIMAKLTGASTFQKAISVQKDYAKSLDKTSKSAKGQTLSIDELNQSVSETEDAAGGGGASDMFEETAIDDQASNFADRLKEMWADADFSDLGHIFGGKIANALDNIKWSSIKNTAGKLGKSLATLINGFVEFPELGYKIGNAIAQAFNTALEFSYNFVHNLHWDSIGKFIGDAINGGVQNFDVKKLAATISEGLKGIMDMWTNALKTVDWQGLGNKIVDFFKEIDYNGIAESFFILLGTAFASAVEFIWGFIEDAVKSIRDYFKEYIDKYIAIVGEDSLGSAIILGILNGIIDALKNIASWVKEHIFDPFIKAFKEAFEIHSPSKVMYRMGGYIVDGLFNGIHNIWDRTKEIFIGFKDKVCETITTMKETVIDIFNALKQGIKTPVNAILSIIEGFCNGIVRGINKVIESLNGLHIDVPEWVTDKFGISSFGFSIPTLSEVSLPRLATGTVVPRQSREFAAILGDNNRETEVVSPLSTIEDAVANVLEPYLRELISNTEKLIDKDTSVKIGDREIARANNRGQKLLGYSLTT